MKSYLHLLFCLLLLATSNCKNQTPQKKESKKAMPEWQNLVTPNTFEGWHIYQDDGTKAGWTVENEVFTFNSDLAKGEGDKSLITDETFTNFEIKFEWMVSDQSNSGFMWGVNEEKNYEFPYETGPEIQIIDPEVYLGDEKNQIHTAGALYDMIAPSSLVTLPAGQWNRYHITINHKVNEGIVVHNGVEINRFPLHGPKWDAMVADSKFAKWEGFGKFPTGSICLQDHPGVIAFRNIKIMRLP